MLTHDHDPLFTEETNKRQERACLEPEDREDFIHQERGHSIRPSQADTKEI
jgi:hypothetical protein